MDTYTTKVYETKRIDNRFTSFEWIVLLAESVHFDTCQTIGRSTFANFYCALKNFVP
jgi:hypothetical protein